MTGALPSQAMDRSECLRGSPLFAALSDEGRARTIAALIARHYERDATIYQRGDEAVAFYGVAEGRVRFSASSMEGKEVVLDHAPAGQWFGEIGLFDSGPRVVDARAAEPTTLFVLPRRELLELCSREPGLLLRFIELFSKRIRVAEDIIIDASFLNLTARLAKKLLTLGADAARSEPTARGSSIRISQDELGRLTGVTRESAGRQLKIWEREGLVEVDYGRVLLLDEPALRRLVTAAIGE